MSVVNSSFVPLNRSVRQQNVKDGLSTLTLNEFGGYLIKKL